MASSKLSPAAQIVWNAAWRLSPVNCESHEDRRRQQIAAALRAAADQVVPDDETTPWGSQVILSEPAFSIRCDLLAIANELDPPKLVTGATSMTDPLSPAARAIWEAFNSKFDWVEDGVPGPQFHAIAAALRAAADQVVPVCSTRSDRGVQRMMIRNDLRAIADELDPPSS